MYLEFDYSELSDGGSIVVVYVIAQPEERTRWIEDIVYVHPFVVINGELDGMPVQHFCSIVALNTFYDMENKGRDMNAYIIAQ